MSVRTAKLEELVIPDGTTVEEHDLVTDGNVVVGGQSTVEFGVRGADVMAGERVEFGGHIEAAGDCRLDMWGEVAEDVLVGGDAYLGERVHVGGGLKVAGDADIGDDVDIEGEFEASGTIEIRNPMPTVVFLVVYLSQLLRIGEEEAADQLATRLVEGDGDDQPVVVPRGARVGDDAWRVSTPARVGDDCRLHGNVRAESIEVGADTTVFGSLRAKGDVTVGEDTEIKGDVTTRDGNVYVAHGTHVWGDISAEDVELHEHAVVEGTIRVSGELTQIRDALGPEPATESPGSDESDSETDADSESDAGRSEPDGETDAEGPDADGESGDETGDAAAAGDGTESSDDEGDGDEGSDAPGEAGDADEIESRAEVEESLEGVIPMDDSGGAAAGENGHDEDAEVTPDAD